MIDGERSVALVSRGGRAVVRAGSCYFVLTADHPEPAPVDGTYWSHLRAFSPDAEVLDAGEPPFHAVRARMIEAWREQLGADLLLMFLDRNFSDGSRLDTCATLERLLAQETWLSAWLRLAALSVAPPEEADLLGARALAASIGATQVGGVVAEVDDARAFVAAALDAWRVAVEALATPAEWSGAAVVGDRTRAVAHAVIALRSASPSAWRDLGDWCRRDLRPALAAVTVDGEGVIDRWLAQVEGLRVVRVAVERGR